MITLKCLNKKDLEKFVLSGAFQTFDFLPITKHRAWSQIKNPNAAEDDILLTLAFEDEQLAGYLGTFPDELILNNNPLKYAWLSTLFVSENFRGKRIAQQLLEKVFEKYDDKIAITEFTKEAESLYAKTKNFDYITPKIGKRFYFKTDFETLIPNKKPKLLSLKPVFKIADSLVNTAISFRLKLAKKRKVNFEISQIIDEESVKFVDPFPKNRNAENLRWILQNPWILEGNKGIENYQFSSCSKEFNYYWIKIFDKNKVLKTVALLQTRNLNLKIPYLFSLDNLDEFASFLEDFISEKKIKTLISYHPKLNEKLSKKKFPKLYQKEAERRYLFHKELIKSLPENYQPNFQDGDGDPVFT
jgi:GNAT superfamily N-acetyltransferase